MERLAALIPRPRANQLIPVSPLFRSPAPPRHVVPSEQELLIRDANTLCLPATLLGEASPLNHDAMKCYRARRSPSSPKLARQETILTDSFETKTYETIKPLLYCNPVDRDGAGIKDPENHLTCYRIKETRGQAPSAPVSIEVVDDFATQQLLPKRSRMLCLSSTRRELAP